MSNLAKAGLSAAKWSTVTTVGRFGLQLITQVVLARLLGPDIYGVFGMGLVVFHLSYFLAMFGFAWSLGQMQTVGEADIRFAFTWQMVSGLVAGTALYFSAAAAAAYFNDPRVVPIVEWMALVCVLNTAAAVSTHLMRRDLNFKAIGLIQFVSYAVGYLLVGISAALLGWGVYALVAAWTTQALTVTVLSYWVKPHSLRPQLVSPQARHIVRTGATAFATNLVNWAANNLDRLVIGRLLSAQSMGVYNAGYNLANLPNSLLISALQPVYLSAGAKAQGERAAQARAYQEILAVIWVLLLPAFFALALLSGGIVHVLYGSAWVDAGPVLALLFLAMPAYVMWGMSTPVLWNMGCAKYEMLLQLPLLPVGAALLYWLTPLGVTHAAGVAALLLVGRGVVVGGYVCHLVAVPGRFLAGTVARGAGLCALLYASHQAANAWWNPQLPVLLQLVVFGLVYAVVGLLAVVVFPRLLSPEVYRVLGRLFPLMRNYAVRYA